MVARGRIVFVILWAVSLVAVAHFTTQAQTVPELGFQVRFLPSPGSTPGTLHGTLLAYVNGQWLPVTLDTAAAPDGNSIVPTRRPPGTSRY
jgi:hypothetical protein